MSEPSPPRPRSNPFDTHPTVVAVRSRPEAPAPEPVSLETLRAIDGEVPVHDSMVVVEYLEDRYPEPALLPADPAERARVRMLITRMTDELGPKFGAVMGAVFASPRDEARITAAQDALSEALAPWDTHLADRTWAAGETFTLADIVMYTQFPSVQKLSGFEVGADRPHLRRWLDRVAARPSVQA